jgi:hypothetical protein
VSDTGQVSDDTERTCDYCGEEPDLGRPGLLGTVGGPNDPYDYLCIRHWRAFERGDLDLDSSLVTDGGTDRPDVETIGDGGGPRDDPLIPCHQCGTEERFMTMKRDPDWTLEYVDSPRWIAFCPDCSPRNDRPVGADNEPSEEVSDRV